MRTPETPCFHHPRCHPGFRRPSEKLIAERLQPETDRAQIDRRIWRLFGETWAVLYTDLSGFRAMWPNSASYISCKTIYESHRILVPIIERGNGILLKTEGTV